MGSNNPKPSEKKRIIMKTKWDYGNLASAYLERPDYSSVAIDTMLSVSGTSKGEEVCDVGAGVAHLTLMLAARDLLITAVEPNDNMRDLGKERTKTSTNVRWDEGTGENTGQSSGRFGLVTFGSSFNVCDREKALEETARILKPGGWFACMWNHRRLEDPIQNRIEVIIRDHIPTYKYGSRREDQRNVIEKSNLFASVIHLNATITHDQSVQQCVEAWRSHATLSRQAGNKFEDIVSDIELYLLGLKKEIIEVPYLTNIWMAQLR